MKINSNVVNSGINRKYTVKRGAIDAVVLGELRRRWNDGEILEYPFYFNGELLFEAPKDDKRKNSWLYEVKYRLGNERRLRDKVIEGVCQDHVTKEFIVWITEAMWIKDIPRAMTYHIENMKRLNHRRSASPNDP